MEYTAVKMYVKTLYCTILQAVACEGKTKMIPQRITRKTTAASKLEQTKS